MQITFFSLLSWTTNQLRLPVLKSSHDSVNFSCLFFIQVTFIIAEDKLEDVSKFLYQCDGEIISAFKSRLPKAKTKKQRGTQGTVEGELTKVRPVGVQTKVQNLYQLDSHAVDPIKDKKYWWGKI